MARRSFALVPLFFCANFPLWAQTTDRVSVTTSGGQSNGGSSGPSISTDGRFVAFWSTASLVSGDTNGAGDVYVRDRVMLTTVRASVSTGGGQAGEGGSNPSISGDGRWVAFDSYSTNLVPSDTNQQQDVFVHDRSTGTTERVSISSAGQQSNGASAGASISSDGRYVAFTSSSSNLVPGDSNGTGDVFVHDRLLHTTRLVSVTASGVHGDFQSGRPSISADGRYVAFLSSATVFGGTLPTAHSRVFVNDLTTGQLELVSVDVAGGDPDGASGIPSISADGRFVAFSSDATNLVTGDTNASIDIFVRDRVLAQTTRVSVSSSGAESHSGLITSPRLSGNGRVVAFMSDATDLVANDNNAVADVFVHDLLTGSTTRASVDSTGQEGSAMSANPSLSADGSLIAFDSQASNLVPADTNGFSDVFVRDLGPGGSIASYCFGDSSGSACPCGNASPVGANAGCLNSLGLGGKLVGLGVPSIAHDTLVLAGSNMPESSTLYFQGTSQAAGGAGAVFGDGLRCASGSVIRLGTELNSGGGSRYPGASDPAISVRGNVAAGSVRTYQCWYRNAALFCQPETFNVTNGVQLTWGP